MYVKKHLDIVTNVIQFKIQFHSMGILFKSAVITWLITKLINTVCIYVNDCLCIHMIRFDE